MVLRHLDGTLSITHGHTGWDVTASNVLPSHPPPTKHAKLWKKRAVEKPKSRLFHHAWKSRKVRGIPTFPQLRPLLAKT
jgi:hypothetical protein